MSNYIEYNDKVAFHPGYYLKEMIEESGLTQEDFAKRLGTTPKNLSVLVHGDQSLSIDIATKLSRISSTSIAYWLNLQQIYDEMQAEFLSDEELKKEREVFKLLDYPYFRENYGLPDLPRNVDEQIKCVREFLSVASLTVLTTRDLSASFRSFTDNLSESNIVCANAMVQIAVNQALKAETPKYDKKKFTDAVEFALTQTENHMNFLPIVKKAFLEAGVVLVVLPNLKNSGINGATKRVDGKILLMVNDRRHYADTFWFSLFHEIGHIINGDFGITFMDEKTETEDNADQYAQKKLIPQDEYDIFISETPTFTEDAIRCFSKRIKRDPGIVLGRLQKDGKIPYTNKVLEGRIRHKYNVTISTT